MLCRSSSVFLLVLAALGLSAAACHRGASSSSSSGASDAALSASAASAAAALPLASASSSSAAVAPEKPGQVASVAVGQEHGCALMKDATVRCWGDNADGQLGIHGGGKWPPTQVPGLTHVAQIAAGAQSSCARLDDGTVRCWGHALGAPTTDGREHGRGRDAHVPDRLDQPDRLGPSPVEGLDQPVTQIAMSPAGQHACALMKDGTVRCWGDNNAGQLGDGTTKSRAKAAPVIKLFAKATMVATGIEHSCALTDAGVFCWGDARWWGEPGDARLRRNPAIVPLLNDASKVALGPFHTCAVRKDGVIACVGKDHGQFCDAKPVKGAYAPMILGVVDLALAQDHAAALRKDGSLVLWGEAEHFGGSPGDCKAPSAAADSTGTEQVAVSEAHDVALRKDGHVVYWDRTKKPALLRGLE